MRTLNEQTIVPSTDLNGSRKFPQRPQRSREDYMLIDTNNLIASDGHPMRSRQRVALADPLTTSRRWLALRRPTRCCEEGRDPANDTRTAA